MSAGLVCTSWEHREHMSKLQIRTNLGIFGAEGEWRRSWAGGGWGLAGHTSAKQIWPSCGQLLVLCSLRLFAGLDILMVELPEPSQGLHFKYGDFTFWIKFFSFDIFALLIVIDNISFVTMTF